MRPLRQSKVDSEGSIFRRCCKKATDWLGWPEYDGLVGREPPDHRCAEEFTPAMLTSDRDASPVSKVLALEFVLIDVLCRQYLQSADPIKTAADHRTHIKRLLSEAASSAQVSGLGRGASEWAAGEFADAIDSIVGQAGQAATQRVNEQRRDSQPPVSPSKLLTARSS
jgi:hypothetical protein